MKRSTLQTFCWAVASVVLSSPAGATILDLSSLPLGPFYAPVTIGAYVLTPNLGPSAPPAIEVVNGIHVLAGTDYGAGDDTFVTRADGGYFTLNSVDIGLIPGYSNGQAVSSPALDISLNGVATPLLQTINFAGQFAHIQSVDLDALIGPYFANIKVSAVPEPSTWALVLLGFGGLGHALRSGRRRQLGGGA